MNKQIVFILFTFVILLSSCGAEYSEKRFIRNSYGKQLDFNWPKQYVLKDSSVNESSSNGSVKIVSYISKQLCTPCFGKYLAVSSDYLRQFPSDSIISVCIVNSRPLDEILSVIDSIDLVRTVIIIDKEDVFLQKNSLEKYSDMYRTFLLDKNDKIVLVGNPLRNIDLQDLYSDMIRKLIQNEGKMSN